MNAAEQEVVQAPKCPAHDDAGTVPGFVDAALLAADQNSQKVLDFKKVVDMMDSMSNTGLYLVVNDVYDPKVCFESDDDLPELVRYDSGNEPALRVSATWRDDDPVVGQAMGFRLDEVLQWLKRRVCLDVKYLVSKLSQHMACSNADALKGVIGICPHLLEFNLKSACSQGRW